MAYYREDLELLLRCDGPSCPRTHRTDEIYFHSACHLDSPTWARYRGDILTIECARCGRYIASVVVASREHDPP